MKKLLFEMRKLCRNSNDGSFATRKKREQVLMLVARQLTHDLGYQHLSVTSLKPKHVDSLVNHWQSQQLSIATLKARMTQLRWWADKINKQNVIARTNAHYGIDDRIYISATSKATQVSQEQIDKIRDPYVQTSLKLAKAFGLRKEEAIKIHPAIADKGDYLYLKPSWCKGRRERSVPILTQEQRDVLNEAKDVAKNASLILPHLQYHQQRNRYDEITRSIGLKRLHGLRHNYAQERYQQLTGWECPHCGGPSRKSLSGEKKMMDLEARLTLSAELGHGRIGIIGNYIGV